MESTASHLQLLKFDSNGGGNSGSLTGAVVAREIRFNGNPGPFHFDEALLNYQNNLTVFEVKSYDLVYNNRDRITGGGSSGQTMPTYEDYIAYLFK